MSQSDEERPTTSAKLHNSTNKYLLGISGYRQAIFKSIRARTLDNNHVFGSVNHHVSGNILNFTVCSYDQVKKEVNVFQLNKSFGGKEENYEAMIRYTLQVWREEKMPELVFIGRDPVKGAHVNYCNLLGIALQNLEIFLQSTVLPKMTICKVMESYLSRVFIGPILEEACAYAGLADTVRIFTK